MKRFVLLTCLLCCNCAPLPACAMESPARLLDLWNDSAEKIWSYDVTVHVMVRAFTDTRADLMLVGDYLLRQQYLQGSWRVDQVKIVQHAIGVEPRIATVPEGATVAFARDFSTQEARYLSSPSKVGQTSSLAAFNRTKLLAPQLYEHFRGDFCGQSYHDMLQPKLKGTTVSFHDGLVCLLIPPAEDSSLLIKDARDWFEVTLDPSKDYLPTRIRKFRDLQSDELLTDIENHWLQVDGGLWVPRSSTKTVYSRQITKGMKAPAAVTVLEIDTEKSRFNIDISPAVFSLPFPTGTVVWDEDRGENYVQAKGDAKDYEAYRQLVRSRMLDSEATKPAVLSAKPYGVVLVAINAVVIVAILVAISLRRFRKSW